MVSILHLIVEIREVVHVENFIKTKEFERHLVCVDQKADESKVLVVVEQKKTEIILNVS